MNGSMVNPTFVDICVVCGCSDLRKHEQSIVFEILQTISLMLRKIPKFNRNFLCHGHIFKSLSMHHIFKKMSTKP